jgi:hypothetical protein
MERVVRAIITMSNAPTSIVSNRSPSGVILFVYSHPVDIVSTEMIGGEHYLNITSLPGFEGRPPEIRRARFPGHE